MRILIMTVPSSFGGKGTSNFIVYIQFSLCFSLQHGGPFCVGQVGFTLCFAVGTPPPIPYARSLVAILASEQADLI